jgi:hypothetical protein
MQSKTEAERPAGANAHRSEPLKGETLQGSERHISDCKLKTEY